jgi:hypothetical protein
MDSHAGDDDLNVFVSKRGDGLTESVVLNGIFRVEEGYLDDGDIQRIVLWVESCRCLSVLKFSLPPSADRRRIWSERCQE